MLTPQLILSKMHKIKIWPLKVGTYCKVNDHIVILMEPLYKFVPVLKKLEVVLLILPFFLQLFNNIISEFLICILFHFVCHQRLIHEIIFGKC